MWNNNFCGFDSFYGPGHWMTGWIFPFLFWGLIIYIVIGLVQKIFNSSSPKQKEDALNILKRRYAKGEIDQKDFEEMKKTLELN